MSFCKSLIAPLLLANVILQADSTMDWLQYNGFGTIGVVHNDNNKILFRNDALSSEGSKGDFSFAPDSKFGLQLDATINDNISATVQGVISNTGDSKNNSRLEWANLKYSPSDALSFRIGRLRAPLYMFSDILNVSYSYPWVRLPQEIYTPVPFTSFNGAQIDYIYLQDAVELSCKYFYGMEKETLVTSPNSGPNTMFKLQHIKGLALTGEYEDLKLRLSYMNVNVTFKHDSLDNLFSALNQYGFSTVTDDLSIDHKNLNFASAGLYYDDTQYFIIAEYMYMKSRSLLGSFQSFYLSGGYHYNQWTPYITIANAWQDNGSIEPRIPSTGPTASLRQIVDSTLGAMNLAQKSYSLGIRYELKDGVALKMQYDTINMDPSHQSIHLRDNNNLDDMHIISGSLDFVF